MVAALRHLPVNEESPMAPIRAGTQGRTECGKGSFYRLRAAISTTTRPYIWRNAVTGKRNHGIIMVVVVTVTVAVSSGSNTANNGQYVFDVRLFTRGNSYHLSAFENRHQKRSSTANSPSRFRSPTFPFRLPIERIYYWNINEYIGLYFSLCCSTMLGY